jgi:RNA polymerase sigma-70 factor (ECF subfamily)
MDDGTRTDRELVDAVQRGNTAAFEGLVERHQKRLFNLLFRWLGSYEEAADATQEVFLSAFRAIKKFRGDAAFATWLYQIGINHARNRRKRMALAAQQTVPLDPPNPDGRNPGPAAFVTHPGPNPAEVAEQREIQELVQRELMALTHDEALLILLRDFQDLDYEEIARILDVPRGTVKSRLHRARHALKLRLAPYFDPQKVKP